ncbi:MAG: hypothetical protein ACKOPO_13235 [Novosphingobium sp.]
MQTDVLVSLVALTACMVLAWRSYRRRNVSFERTAIMAVSWVVIFGALVFLSNRFGVGAP